MKTKDSNNKIAEAKLINEGLEDVEQGKLIDGKEVLDEMKKKFNF